MSLFEWDSVGNEYVKGVFTDRDNLNKIDVWIKAWRSN